MTALLYKIASMISPLSEFYDSTGDVLPHIEVVEGLKMPQPYRRLLVHNNDMTPTLEAFTRQSIHLKLLAKLVDDGVLYREVALTTDDTNEPIEFGAIKIHLERFSDAARRLIVEGHYPLGTILNDHGIEHTSRPTGYFSIDSDSMSRHAFGLIADTRLYGRHNVLSNTLGGVLAEVVEILPPLEEPNAS